MSTLNTERRGKPKQTRFESSAASFTKEDNSYVPAVISGWTEETPKTIHDSDEHLETKQEEKKSVLDFDRNEIAPLEEKKVSECNDEELLKILIRRGEMKKTDTIFGPCKSALQRMNGESTYQPREFKSFNQNKFQQQQRPFGNKFEDQRRFMRPQENTGPRRYNGNGSGDNTENTGGYRSYNNYGSTRYNREGQEPRFNRDNRDTQEPRYNRDNREEGEGERERFPPRKPRDNRERGVGFKGSKDELSS